MIRVESEETQDYLREEKITEFEEEKQEKQRTFIPSAVSVPLKPLFRCDKQRSDNTLSSWQLASVDECPVSEVFQQTLAGKRRRTTDKCEVEAGCGKEGVSGKNVENDGERVISARDAGTFLQ